MVILSFLHNLLNQIFILANKLYTANLPCNGLECEKLDFA